MIKKGEGLFQRGERLTAAKLNEAIMPSHVTVAGAGAISRGPEGDVIQVDIPEAMYIRLTAKDTGNTPIRYAWKEVSRLANGTWLNTTRTGNSTADYAMELNNANLSTSDDYIYRAERSPSTGEWLFFLRRSATPSTPGSNITVLFSVLPGTSYAGWLCDTAPQINGVNGTTAFSPSVPSDFRIANVTLSYTTDANATTTIGVWTSSNGTYGNVTFTPPYEPNGTRPLTITCDAGLANGTILGFISRDCGGYEICNNTFDIAVLDNQGAQQLGFYGRVAGNTTANSIIRTSAGGTVNLIAKVNANGSVDVPVPTITLPTCLTYTQDWTCSGATCCSTLVNFLNAPRVVAATYSSTGVTSSHSNTSTPFTRQGSSAAIIGWTLNEDWTTLPAWPTVPTTYYHGVLEEGFNDRGSSSASPVRTITANQSATYYGSPASSVSSLTGIIPATASIFDSASNNYTLGNSTFVPSGSCS